MTGFKYEVGDRVRSDYGNHYGKVIGVEQDGTFDDLEGRPPRYNVTVLWDSYTSVEATSDLHLVGE